VGTVLPFLFFDAGIRVALVGGANACTFLASAVDGPKHMKDTLKKCLVNFSNSKGAIGTGDAD
jgi:hypothetical protein